MDQDIELPPWPKDVPAPKLICFDLDDTIWFPEMYMMSGAPFELDDELRVYDRRGEEVKTYPAARAALRLIHTDPALTETKVAYASRTNKFDWATTCMRLLDIGGREQRSLEQMCDYLEISSGTKKIHFGKIRQDSGVAYKDMLFFDNEEDNIDEVSQLGVKCVYCPRGMDEPSWEKGVRLFAGAGARA